MIFAYKFERLNVSFFMEQITWFFITLVYSVVKLLHMINGK